MLSLFYGQVSRKVSSMMIQPQNMTRVTIKQGELQGSLESLSSGKTFASFKGIPYAKPPVGDLRFRAPCPPESWSGVREATEHGPICVQWDLVTHQTLDGGEDCLYLNVYTPEINGPPLPVMVYFHGGAFQSGSGDSFMYGPDYLVEEGVVLVTANFRLEALGLLCLENKDAPGNAAMKDQVQVLRWVQENISKFGGDPANVTIFGESSGGVSCTYHTLSPMSKGLFHKIIVQSASIYNEWAISYNNLKRAFRLAKLLGKETKDVNELVAFLKNIEPVKLTRVGFLVATEEENKRGLPIHFCPVVEKPYEGEESFLLKSPDEILKEGNFMKVPIMIGYNSAEGMIFIKEALKKSKLINEDFTRKLPRDIFNTVTPELAKKLGENIRQFYFGDKPLGKETINQIVDLESDYNFSFGVQKYARTMVNLSEKPLYFYRFSFEGDANFTKANSGYPDVKGACHVDDLFYLFKTWMKLKEGSASRKTMKRMTKMWTNFAKYSDPTPQTDELIPVKWKPMTSKEGNFLEIDSELKMDVDPDSDRYNFWVQLYKDAQKSGIKSSL